MADSILTVRYTNLLLVPVLGYGTYSAILQFRKGLLQLEGSVPVASNASTIGASYPKENPNKNPLTGVPPGVRLRNAPNGVQTKEINSISPATELSDFKLPTPIIRYQATSPTIVPMMNPRLKVIRYGFGPVNGFLRFRLTNLNLSISNRFFTTFGTTVNLTEPLSTMREKS
jgi:hypothetical protein